MRPRLLTIPGVAQVIPIGGEVRQYRVSPQPAALRALGLSHEQLESALTQFGVNTGGGFTDQYSREYLIRNIGRTTSLDDLRNLVVARIEQCAGLSAPGGRSRFRAALQARRRWLYGQAGGHRLGREATPCRHRSGSRARSSRRLKEMGPSLPARRARRPRSCSGRPTSSKTRSTTSRTVLLEAAVVGRDRPVRVPAQLAHHGDFAHRHPGLDPRDRGDLPRSPGSPSTR